MLNLKLQTLNLAYNVGIESSMRSEDARVRKEILTVEASKEELNESIKNVMM